MLVLRRHKSKAVDLMWKINPTTEILINLNYRVNRERESSKVDLIIGNMLEESSSTGNLRLTGRY
jgi:hypothetical protein